MTSVSRCSVRRHPCFAVIVLVFLNASCNGPTTQEVPDAVVSSKPVSSSAAPKCVPDADSLDFGKVLPFEPHEKIIRISNEGGQPLILSPVGSSCGCTVVELATREIPPGQSADLKIGLKLDTYPKNEVRTRVVMGTNDPESKALEIPVNADIQPEYRIEPETLDFGTIKRGRPQTRTCMLLQTGPQDLAITGVEAPPELEVAYKEVQPSATLVAADNAPPAKAFEVAVTIKPDIQAESVNARVFLGTNIPRMPRQAIEVKAKLTGIECTIMPRVVVFGPSPSGTEAARLEITGQLPFDILNATCTIPDLAPTVECVEPQRRYRVVLQLASNATPGDKVGKLRLEIREDALTETREVTVYGTVAAKSS